MKLLTPAETAERLGISERTLRGLRRDGEIAYVALDARKIRHSETDIAEYLAQRRRRDTPGVPQCQSTSQKNSPHFHFDFQFKGNRFHGSTGCTTERLARQFEARERQKAALPKLARPLITIDEACGLYAEHAENQNSWKTTEYLLTDIVKHFGPNRLLSAVSQRDLMTYFAKRRTTGRKGNRSNSTINREIENMRAVWKRAERARYDIGEMPDWSALFLKVSVQPYAELSNDDKQDSLLAAIRSDVRPAVEFLLMSGWRRNEVLGLRWTDLDLRNRMAWTRLKGGDVV